MGNNKTLVNKTAKPMFTGIELNLKIWD